MRPTPPEYAEFYGSYVERVPDGDIVETLERQMADTVALLERVPPSRETHRYERGKWSLREVVGHVLDAERLFGFRALWFARGDASALPGMEQDEWVRESGAGSRPLAELVEELRALRHSHVLMFRGLAERAWGRGGMASGSHVTVRALAWIMAGHELHHREGIRTRYLGERAEASAEGGG